MRSGSVFLITVAATLLSAQTPFTGVIEGFTFDVPTRSVRPVLGSLGSAVLGQPIFGGLTYGSVSPHQTFALVFHDEHFAVLSGLGTSQTKLTQVPGAFAIPDGVAWSGDGATAILFSRTGNWIQAVSGLPASVSPAVAISLDSLGGSLASVATDLHGGRIVVGVTGPGAGIYRIENGASFVPLLSLAKPVALAFSEDGGTLYALDGAGGLVAQNAADLSYQTWPLTGIADAVAIRPARDTSNRAVVYVAGRSDRLLQAYDASTHQVVATAPLSFSPNTIEGLGVGSFLLESRATTDDILWSFRNAPQPLVYFVPATPVRLRESHRK